MYDARSGNFKEHVFHFIETMGRHFHNIDICLKELSKSLTDKAHTWYANLKPSTVHDWTHLVYQFNSKFFYAEARFTLAKLGRIQQHSNEGRRICKEIL